MNTFLMRATGRSVALLMLPVILLAQQEEQPTRNSLLTSGFVDFYYGINFNRPVSRTNSLHVFDQRSNEIRFSLARFTVQQEASPIGFRVDLGFGPTSDAVHYQDPNSTTNFLQQAYFTAVLPVGEGLTVDVGKFVTHMGYELIESKDNANYSRSVLFGYAIPFFHVGARLSYPVAEDVTIAGYLYNGWDRGVTDNNKSKTFGATLNIAAIPSTGLILNWIGGPELDDDSDDLHVFDVIINHDVTEKFSVGINADYGFSETPAGTDIWKGAALYLKYLASDVFSLAARGEYFKDQTGARTGTVQDVKEFTITVEHKFTDAMVTRLEFRRDICTTPFFDSNHAQNLFVWGTVVSF